MYFNPRDPHAFPRPLYSIPTNVDQFQSTHPVRGGTISGWRHQEYGFHISIHPPRAGWDNVEKTDLGAQADFNPPTPCGVGRCRRSYTGHCVLISIHPPRAGWDLANIGKNREIIVISIHPPRAGWDFSRHQSTSLRTISIHPPRAGWDQSHCHISAALLEISIHPPRAGWDRRTSVGRSGRRNFNPPTPCGVGRVVIPFFSGSSYFNPPTPCGVGRTAETAVLGSG